MSTQGTLQNQKYQTCIDACNSCAEACEYCATCDLHEQNVKTMASCVQINRDCANICWTASQGIASIQNKYAMFVQIFAKRVLRNVNDILIWTIVKNAHRHVEDVPKNVVKCERRIFTYKL